MDCAFKTEGLNVLVAADVYKLFADLWPGQHIGELNWMPFDLSGPRDGLADLLPVTDCLVTIYHDLKPQDYAKAKRLKLIQLPSAGHDCINIDLAKKHGVMVANNGGANATSVAEHAIMLMLALCRQLLFHHNTVVKGDWVNRKYQNQELQGKQLGIIGLGNIGSHLAGLAKGFGMHVSYTDIRNLDLGLTSMIDLVYLPLSELLRTSDIVSLHVPLTSLTSHMINAETLSMMKPNAWLINTSRGPVVDEKALVEALAKGNLAGAGLDVFEVEPLPVDSPLLRMDNVVFSPHSGPSRESRVRISNMVVENLCRVKDGVEPLYRLDI